jgi:hypothetical protein
LEDAPKRHWGVVVSLDNRNLGNNTSSILIVPFGSYGEEGPTTISLPAAETGLAEKFVPQSPFHPGAGAAKEKSPRTTEANALFHPNAPSGGHDSVLGRSRCALGGETIEPRELGS